MKEIIKYECEICHYMYADKEYAVKCEQSHKKPDKLLECTDYESGKYEEYPRFIWVGAEGERACYKFFRVEGGNVWV